jgi:hypothetical protein
LHSAFYDTASEGGRNKRRRLSIMSRLIIPDFKRNTSPGNFIRTMFHSRWPASIKSLGKGLLLGKVDQLAFDDVDLLPEIMR